MRVTRRRVIVDRHPVAEKLDDDATGPDDRQRSAGRDASPGPETPGVGEQYGHGGVGPDTVFSAASAAGAGCGVLRSSRDGPDILTSAPPSRCAQAFDDGTE